MNSLRGLIEFEVTDPSNGETLKVETLVNFNALRIWAEMTEAADLDEALDAYNKNPVSQVPRLLFSGYRNLQDARGAESMAFERFAALLGTVENFEEITAAISDSMNLGEENFPTGGKEDE